MAFIVSAILLSLSSARRTNYELNAISSIIKSAPMPAPTVIFTESFETPKTSLSMPIHKLRNVDTFAWWYGGRASFVKVFHSGMNGVTTTFGDQFMRVHGYGSDGPSTSTKVLKEVVQPRTKYTLTFNVARSSGYKGDYRVELAVAEPDATFKNTKLSILAKVTGEALKKDMSETDVVEWTAPDADADHQGTLGKRIVIRLNDEKEGTVHSRPAFDNLVLTRLTLPPPPLENYAPTAYELSGSLIPDSSADENGNTVRNPINADEEVIVDGNTVSKPITVIGSSRALGSLRLHFPRRLEFEQVEVYWAGSDVAGHMKIHALDRQSAWTSPYGGWSTVYDATVENQENRVDRVQFKSKVWADVLMFEFSGGAGKYSLYEIRALGRPEQM